MFANIPKPGDMIKIAESKSRSMGEQATKEMMLEQARAERQREALAQQAAIMNTKRQMAEQRQRLQTQRLKAEEKQTSTKNNLKIKQQEEMRNEDKHTNLYKTRSVPSKPVPMKV